MASLSGSVQATVAETAGFRPETKRQWYASFLWICDETRHKRERAYHLFVARFKEKPPWHWRETVRPAQSTVEQRNFVRSRDIAFAKSRGL